MKNHYKNDVWERRTEPPKDFNKELPEWTEKEKVNILFLY